MRNQRQPATQAKLFIRGRDGKHRFFCEHPCIDVESFARRIAKLRQCSIVIVFPNLTERLMKKNGFLSARQERTPRKNKKRKPNRFTARRIWKRRTKR